jgi:predicted lipoprotein
MKKNTLYLLAVAMIFAACKKDPETTETPVVEDLTRTVLSSFSSNVAQDVYTDLYTQTNNLYTNVLLLSTETTDANLLACKQSWKDARLAWERSEAFLFGPVATENIDPRIDTWPVNFQDLEGQLASSNTFTQSYIDGLQDALKGFHPIEYLLFGQNGNKTAAEMTARETEYLLGLTENLKTLISQLDAGWNSGTSNYSTEFSSAGNGSAVYGTKLSAYEELVNGMIGICDEVANGKIAEPFLLQDASLEESPFAFNSITDFTNNIRGVESVYLGKYTNDGAGLEDLVREHNLSLDAAIKNDLANAIAALNNITVPFGQAITEQPVQVQAAIDAINHLAETLETELLPLVQLHID